VGLVETCVQFFKFSIKNDYTSGSVVSSCRHDLTRSRVADGGTASNMEGRCEHIE